MSKMRRHRHRGPSPSVAEPRRPLLLGAYSFVRAARLCPGVLRIALLGSLATAKAVPKDVDLLVTIERAVDLAQLARAGRRLQGLAQTINLGADIFLADTAGRYLGRICHYREPRVACHAQHCGLRTHLNDDLHRVTLSKDLTAHRDLRRRGCRPAGSKLRLKIFSFDAKRFWKILGAQKLIYEGMIGSHLSLDMGLERVYLIFLGGRKTPHRLLNDVNVALRGLTRFLEIFNRHGADDFQRVLFGFHMALHSACVTAHNKMNVTSSVDLDQAQPLREPKNVGTCIPYWQAVISPKRDSCLAKS
jgi:hypothetical protein